MKLTNTLTHVVALAVTAAVSSHPLFAQLPDASAAGFSMAGNYTGVARGFEAIAYNPANLALERPRAMTLGILAGGFNSGINPVHFSDFRATQNVPVPAATRESWLNQIGNGRETGRTDAGLSLLALTIRRLGVQVGVSGAGDVNLNQDAAEALLFGNAGRTGAARTLDFSGSNANGSLFGVGAVSYAIPLETDRAGGRVAFGLTAKYIRGIVAARAADHGSATTADQISVNLPLIYTDSNHIGNAGHGYALDVGLAWIREGTTYSLTARNVVNTFAWSSNAFSSRANGFSFDGTNSVSSFDTAPYTSAPAAMRSAFEAERFKPEIAFGIAQRTGDVLVSMDGSRRWGNGIATGPATHTGIGVEYTGIRLLALRTGAAKITGGYQGAAGVGVRVGAFEMSAGAMRRSMDGRRETGFIFSLMSLQ
jgi:hypothetical protein